MLLMQNTPPGFFSSPPGKGILLTPPGYQKWVDETDILEKVFMWYIVSNIIIKSQGWEIISNTVLNTRQKVCF